MMAPSFKLRVKSIRSKDLTAIYIGSSFVWLRPAQVRRMRVGDVQVSARRLMVPGSYKGRGGNSGSDPVPVGDDVIAVLLPAIAGRPSDAPLFERWIHEHEPGGIVWKKSERSPWKRGELARPWKAIRERAGMPEVIPYALRHSSIVRGLRKGLPIQQVAHDAR